MRFKWNTFEQYSYLVNNFLSRSNRDRIRSEVCVNVTACDGKKTGKNECRGRFWRAITVGHFYSTWFPQTSLRSISFARIKIILYIVTVHTINIMFSRCFTCKHICLDGAKYYDISSGVRWTEEKVRETGGLFIGSAENKTLSECGGGGGNYFRIHGRPTRPSRRK